MAATRRSTLAASLAAPALIAANQADAQGPATPPRRQAPGFYCLRIGTFDVTVVNDAIARRDNPGEGFVRNADAAAVRAVLADRMLPTTHLDNTFNIAFVDTGSDLILFDTGTGGLLAPTTGTMLDNMAAAGIDPARVTRIVLTHFHSDHVSGLASREGGAVSQGRACRAGG